MFFLDYDGTLTAGQYTSITLQPVDDVLQVLRALTAEPRNKVCLFSGRPKAELQEWFASVVSAGGLRGHSVGALW